MIVLFQVLMNYEVAANATFLGVRLEHSVFQGLAMATNVTLQEGVRAGITNVLSGIAANPAGLANVGLYLPGLILTVLISGLTWFQQKMTGASDNPQMATMNIIMPFFMAYICLGIPGGVVVYWGASSLIGIIQQWVISKRTKIELEKKPILYKNKPIDGKGDILSAEEDEDEYEDDDEEYEEYEDDEEEYEDEEDQKGKR
jgi:YidC/Oxa1 family membrane protein insertase